MPRATPIPWSVEAVRAFLAGYGLTPRQLYIQQLESWWLNLVLQVEADGERLILRRYGITPAEEVRWELALLDHLNADDFPTLRPLRRQDGAPFGDFAGKPAILYPYVEGRSGCHPEIDRGRAMADTATLIGNLHQLTQNLALPFPRVSSGADSRRLLTQLQSWVGDRGIGPDEPRLAELLVHVARVQSEFDTRLAPHAHTLPRGIVHRDAHCANVLFEGARLAALIDFDDACPDYLMADLPVLLDGWATDPTTNTLVPEQVRAILSAYTRVRPLTPAEGDLLPDFHLLYLLGDCAAEVYETGRHEDSPEHAIAEWTGYRRFLQYAADPTWRDTLVQALASL